MKQTYPILFLFILLISMLASGCVSQSPEEAVETSIVNFLNAVNEGEVGIAFDMYVGKDFLAPASISMIFDNKGIEEGSIKEINIVSQEVRGDLAIAEVACSISTLDLTGNEKDVSTVPIYFRLQNSELGWIITRVSFNTPLTFDNSEMVDIEVESTSIDVIADNAPVISAFAFIMLGSGVYLDRKDKAKKKQSMRTIDVSGATAVQKETMAQYVKFIPAQQATVGKPATVDVWVKNFTQQPYENFAVKAKFGNTVDVESTNLFFDTVAPGDTVKKTWVIKPKSAGWISIEEPTVVFEYAGTKYIGVLDPVWVQVQ